MATAPTLPAADNRSSSQVEAQTASLDTRVQGKPLAQWIERLRADLKISRAYQNELKSPSSQLEQFMRATAYQNNEPDLILVLKAIESAGPRAALAADALCDALVDAPFVWRESLASLHSLGQAGIDAVCRRLASQPTDNSRVALLMFLQDARGDLRPAAAVIGPYLGDSEPFVVLLAVRVCRRLGEEAGPHVDHLAKIVDRQVQLPAVLVEAHHPHYLLDRWYGTANPAKMMTSQFDAYWSGAVGGGRRLEHPGLAGIKALGSIGKLAAPHIGLLQQFVGDQGGYHEEASYALRRIELASMAPRKPLAATGDAAPADAFVAQASDFLRTKGISPAELSLQRRYTGDEVWVMDLDVGGGESLGSSGEGRAHYQAWRTDGTLVVSSYQDEDQPVVLTPSPRTELYEYNHPGLGLAVGNMRVGGRRYAVLPPTSRFTSSKVTINDVWVVEIDLLGKIQ